MTILEMRLGADSFRNHRVLGPVRRREILMFSLSLCRILDRVQMDARNEIKLCAHSDSDSDSDSSCPGFCF